MMKRVTTTARRWVGPVAILTSALLLATACTGSHSTKKTTSPPASNGQSTTAGATPRNTKPTPSPVSTVPTSAGAPTRPPVPISSTATFAPQVSARITSIRSVNATANLPGEIGGPAVAVTITLTNGTSKALSMQAVVNLYWGAARTPATTISGAPTKVFPDSVGARASVTGTYTFTLPVKDRSDVRIEFSYSGSSTTVLFDGAAS